jgi:hypothetical protein
MLSMITKTARKAGVDTRKIYHALSASSIKAAIREQQLAGRIDRLRTAVPDLRDQYTGEFDEDEYARYWEIKMRSLHAWQVRCVERALDHLPKPTSGNGHVIADIGDSSGNHAKYIQCLLEPGRVTHVVSVNLDPVAIEKIKAKGGDAILCRAEDLGSLNLNPDLFVSFEMIEHLTDPVRILHSLATSGNCPHLLVTVPYRRDSRFGSQHVRQAVEQMPDRMTAEVVHMFELSPQDWIYLARLAGYKLVFKEIWLQYPRRGLLRLLAPLWRKTDFEGFLALFLERDLTVEKRYQDW